MKTTQYRISSLLAFRLVLLACIVQQAALALPSLDSKLKTTWSAPDGSVYTLIQDADDPNQYYYVPPQVRLETRTENGKIIPQLSLLTWVDSDKVEHSVIQAMVTATAPRDYDDAMKSSICDYVNQRNASLGVGVRLTPMALRLAPVGPVRGSKVKLLLLQTKNSGCVLTPSCDETAGASCLLPVDASGPLDPTRAHSTNGLTIAPESTSVRASGYTAPGGSYLSQGVWLSFQVQGLATTIYEDLLTAGTSGGLIVLMESEYDALSISADIRATMRRDIAMDFLQKRETVTKNAHFLCWGNNSTSVRETIEMMQREKSCLKLEGIITPNITPERYDAIEGKLLTWITSVLCNPKPIPQAGEAVQARADNTTPLLNVSQLVQTWLPSFTSGLSLGFGRSTMNYSYEYKARDESEAIASWSQRFVMPQKFVCYGALSLKGYPQETIRGSITRVETRGLPSLTLRMPFTAGKPGFAEGADVHLSLGGPGKDAVFTIRNGQWSPVDKGGLDFALPTKNLLLAGMQVGKEGVLKRANAVLYLSKLNPENSRQEMIFPLGGAFTVTQDTNGVLDLDNAKMGIRTLEVDPTGLVWPNLDAVQVDVLVHVEHGEAKLASPEVPFTFTVGKTNAQSIYYTGDVTSVSVVQRTKQGESLRFLLPADEVLSLNETGHLPLADTFLAPRLSADKLLAEYQRATGSLPSRMDLTLTFTNRVSEKLTWRSDDHAILRSVLATNVPQAVAMEIRSSELRVNYVMEPDSLNEMSSHKGVYELRLDQFKKVTP